MKKVDAKTRAVVAHCNELYEKLIYNTADVKSILQDIELLELKHSNDPNLSAYFRQLNRLLIDEGYREVGNETYIYRST